MEFDGTFSVKKLLEIEGVAKILSELLECLLWRCLGENFPSYISLNYFRAFDSCYNKYTQFKLSLRSFIRTEQIRIWLYYLSCFDKFISQFHPLRNTKTATISRALMRYRYQLIFSLLKKNYHSRVENISRSWIYILYVLFTKTTILLIFISKQRGKLWSIAERQPRIYVYNLSKRAFMQ